MCQGIVGVCVFIEEGDEAAADDGTGGVGLCCFECLFVADAEANHAGVYEVHVVDAVEVGLFLGVEFFLGACCGGGGYHIDESVGVVVDEADAFFACFWGDEHDDFEVVLIGNGLIVIEIVFEWEVGDYHAVDAACYTMVTEAFEAEMEDGVEVAHEDEWYLYVFANVF